MTPAVLTHGSVTTSGLLVQAVGETSGSMLFVASLLLAPALAAAAVLVWPRRPPAWRPGGGRTGLVDTGPAAEVDLVAEGLDLMSLALLGGGSLAAAATGAGAVLPGELGEELVSVGRALDRGEDVRSAWDLVGERWRPARQALELAAVAGVAPGEALGRAAADLRQDAVARVEVAAARLGVALVVPLGLAFLPAFVLTTIVPLLMALVRDVAW